MVYYRKYRPQTIEELDSTKVRETLKSVLRGVIEDSSSSTTTPVKQANSVASAPSVPHAFLFTGPKGLGKTSTARIIAKIVNCTNKKKGSVDPCNECESCISITNGSNIDVLEIDGASNRGIDEIRDLREKVKLAPSSALKKVYIIDEVHMLTTEAFNALLKTIEEPPSHVMFMFATTEPQKVPATILSRCFHVAFPRATDEDIVHSLERIVKGEGLEIDKDALGEIARMADGGFRDSAKILEEVVALSEGKKITKELFEEKYKVSNILYFVSAILQSLQSKNAKESVGVIQKIVEQGTDVKYFLSQVLDNLHELLLQKVGLGKETRYNQQEANFLIEDIKELTELFSKAYQDTKYAVVPQLPLELAVIEWCSAKQNEEESIIAAPASTQQSQKIEIKDINSNQDGTGFRIKSGMTSKGPTIDETRKKEQTLKVRSILDGKKDEKPTPVVVAGVSQNSIPHNISELTQLMDNIIYKVKPFNHSLAGVLRGCDIASYNDATLVFETSYKFHKERLDEAKAKDIIQQAIKEITGKSIVVSVMLKGGE